MLIIERKDLDQLLELWNTSYNVEIPRNLYGEIMLLPYEKSRLELNYINFAQPVKEFLFKSKETLFKWKLKNNDFEVMHSDENTDKSTILFGVRACDLNGIAYMDRFFLGEFNDDVYKRNREHIILVGLNCTKAGENCFCDSTQKESGPLITKGYDLVFTPAGESYLVEIGTSKGEKLVELGKHFLKESEIDGEVVKKGIYKSMKGSFTKKMNADGLENILKAGFNDEIWNQAASKCMGCGGCTNVCPTCTCFNVVEENKDDNSGSRVRCWDSCQNDSFTRNAGGHNPRNNVSKARYRIYDKLMYIEERFGYKGCTGCGRCIKVCPISIDIVDTVNTLSEKYKDLLKGDSKPTVNQAVPHEHRECEKVYLPQIAVIKDIIIETRNIKRFVLKYEDENLQRNMELVGQFFEITVFGVGEIAISIPFSPNQKDYYDFCVKKAGKVTNALHSMKIGDKVGLRGPFGKGFPYEDMKGKDILIVGSGVGIAPVRNVIARIAEDRNKFGKVVVIASALSYEDLIYKEDFLSWEKNSDIKVLYALNKPSDRVKAHVGYINDLLPDLDNDWGKTAAVICASPRRIKEVAKDLLKLGMSGKDIMTTLETHMRCGIGKCGHCKVGSKYMCVDGPVFNFDEMLELPPEF